MIESKSQTIMNVYSHHAQFVTHNSQQIKTSDGVHTGHAQFVTSLHQNERAFL